MSNALAVPAVTAAVVTLVQNAVDDLGITPGPVVAAADLAKSGPHARVGVFLHQVTRNGQLAASTVPTRAADGTVLRRPTAALDLHYLVCFRADDQWDVQTMLARVAAELSVVTVVSPALLTAAEAAHAEVVGNDLRTAEPVHIVADTISLDDLTRLWSLYPVGSHAPALAVRAGPVLVEAGSAAATGLPVRRIGLGAASISPLRLDAVVAADGPGAPVRASAPMPPLTLVGAGLSPAEGVVSAVVDGDVRPLTAATDDRATLATTGLLPGRHRVAVRHELPPLDAAVSATPVTRSSETRTFDVLPTLGALSRTASGPASGRQGTITAAVVPAVSRDQRVRLLLDAVAGGGAAALPAPALPAGGTGSVAFAFTGLPAGTYRVTLEVDGMRSLPPTDAGGAYVLPTVSV